MKRVLQLVVLVGLLYAGLQYLRPWILQWSGDVGLGGGSDGQRCVGRLVSTYDEIVDKVEKWGGPPVQLDRWAGAHRLLMGWMDELRRQCECESEACAVGREAAAELEGALARIDAELRAARSVDLREQMYDVEKRVTEASAVAARE